MPIEIRPLTLADDPFLWEIAYHAIYVPPGQPPPPREVVQKPEFRRYVEGWGKPDDLGFIALEDRQPVGAVWLRLLTGDDKGYGYVDDTTPELSIAVLPSYRGRGIGTKLLARLLEEAASRYPSVCLSVSSENPAKNLYQRFGFEVVRENGSSLTMVRKFKR